LDTNISEDHAASIFMVEVLQGPQRKKNIQCAMKEGKGKEICRKEQIRKHGRKYPEEGPNRKDAMYSG
jgi:hypothetical protein